MFSKMLPSSPEEEDVNARLTSPKNDTTFLSNYTNPNSLEQRVQEFDKTAKYMIKKLEMIKERIESCSDGEM